jgi:hypothetical protein
MLAVVLAAPILYVLSFGPACWLTAIDNRIAYTDFDKNRPPQAMLIYSPLGSLACRESGVGNFLIWWMACGVRSGFAARSPTLPDDGRWLTTEPGGMPCPFSF